MKILAVDDDQLMLDTLLSAIRQAAPLAEVFPFRKPSEALAFAAKTSVDAAFLDIRMRGMDGLELGRKLLALYPALNIIYCSCTDEYLSEAFREVRCNGYITKPVTPEKISDELQHLRVPIRFEPTFRVRFQCLGRFEAFADDKPIPFKCAKTKELLAYLVHARGGLCSNQEIIASLWYDDNRHDSYFKKIRKDLILTLTQCGCSDILLQQRGGLALNTARVSCDYYRWKEQNSAPYPGEYMAQYSWANLSYFEL